jgi:adenylate cyclase
VSQPFRAIPDQAWPKWLWCSRKAPWLPRISMPALDLPIVKDTFGQVLFCFFWQALIEARGAAACQPHFSSASANSGAAVNDTLLDTRLSGTLRTRFLIELFGNTAIFPFANIVFELLMDGTAYFRAPDLYAMVLAMLVQTYYLTRWEDQPNPHRFLGNLIAPALYTAGEGLLEGADFFAEAHHVAFWGFAIVIGTLQAIGPRMPRVLAAISLITESIIRTSILFFMYGFFEVQDDPTRTNAATFFNDGSHRFLAAAAILLGLGSGLASITTRRYLQLLKKTTSQLKVYSEWLLGTDLLNRIVANPNSLALTRQERSILFMDIRGFTLWSDAQGPEAVASLLNQYYHLSELAFASSRPIKYKFTADEVMAIFVRPEDALAAAVQLREQTLALLSQRQLGAGIGLHTGPVAEGLLGSSSVKFYDVIGDTVNVTKRIESSARSAEILFSENLRLALKAAPATSEQRSITVKGKPEPLAVHLLA